MKKILVIEDEKLVQLNIIKTLKFEGFEAIGAENGEVGIRLAKEIQPDLILCDIMMPLINGYDVQAELRQDPTTHLIPLIFLTAKVERADMRLGMNLGADDYLTKPFSRDELLETIFSRLDKQNSVHKHFQKKIDQIRDNITTSLPEKLFIPLENIRSFLERLQNHHIELLPSDIREELSNSCHSATQLEQYLQKFFLYSILETTKQNPQQADALRGNCETQSKEIIGEVVQQKAAEYGRDTTIQLALTPCSVPISEANLVNIVEELVDNALRYSPQSSEIQISSVSQNGQFQLQIMNEIQDPALEYPSASSEAQDSPTQRQTGGAGLGLAIVKQLIDLHKGNLRIESRANSTVIVEATISITQPSAISANVA